MLSLVTHSAADPSLNHVVSGAFIVQNNVGLLGAYISGVLNDVFGIAAYIWPLVFGAVGAACISALYELVWWRWLGYFFLTLCLLFFGAAFDIQLGDIQGGGMIGKSLYYNVTLLLNPMGAGLLWFFFFVMGTQLAFGFSWLLAAKRVGAALVQTLKERAEQKNQKDAEPPSAQKRSLLALPASLYGIMQKFKALGQKSSQAPMALPEMHMDVQALAKEENTDEHSAQNAPEENTEKKSDSQENSPVIVLGDSIENTSQEAAANTGPEIDIYEDESPSSTQEDDDDFFAPPTKNNSTQENTTLFIETPLPHGIDDPALRIVPTHEAEAPMAEEIPSAEVFSFSEDIAQDQNQAEQEDFFAGETLSDAIILAEPATPKAQKTIKISPITGATLKKQRVPLPALDILQKGQPASHAAKEEMEAKGQALITCLGNFGIQGELVRITPGPVVTMYEVRPAAGIRVNRIANLSDDLALALKAIAVRIQAPIPGSDTVGIEIPNVTRHMVNFREILESKEFTNHQGALNMALGKNIAGIPFVADLSRMPHLLVAGATGAGKSVGLNSILLSLLYTTYPDEMQLLLIDPKRIEMAVYADLPHLVHPVVTDMQHAKTALEWAVHEMDERYAAMARLGVRNIEGYNQKLKSYKGALPPNISDLSPLPYLVVIIDELADLMLTAAREVETSIVRLAQLARAAGIHMILATQRPSVDVVTGLIKANFPCRISFQVTSKHDSRTILDTVGAEHLLGKGDMLFKPSGGKLMRLHGPFVPDEEVQAVVDHWKKQLPPAYKVDFSAWNSVPETGYGAALGSQGGDMGDDALYGEVRAFVEEQGKASISLIQRRFRIGFIRAARLVEQLESDGIVTPADGSKPRTLVK